MTDAAKAYESQTPGVRLRFTFGASGLLKDRLLGGERDAVAGEVAQRRVAGAEVVDGESHAELAQPVGLQRQERIVVEEDRLGDLEGE